MSLRHTANEDSVQTGELDRFERNRFFYGKLMTARDMQTEQAYHANRLHTLSRFVAGEGIVCGLETSVSETVVNDTAKLEVTIEPGYALDCHGRPVVVRSETSKYLDVPDTDDISLYLTYEECLAETVPVPGSGDACEQDCDYNRVLEVFEVTYESTSSDVLAGEGVATTKPVPDVKFPTQADVTDDEVAALDAIARSYYEDETGRLHACDTCEDPRVFLGAFTTDGSEWVRAASTAVRPHVYTNDMLYAALARHATDFDNPHEVTAAQAGSPVSVEGVENPGGDIDLDSPADTVAITAAAEANRIDLDVSDSFQAELDQRFADLRSEFEARLDDHEERLDDHEERLAAAEEQLSSLRHYVMNKTLKYKMETFSGVALRFSNKTAQEVSRRAKDAIENEAYADVDAYRSFIENVADLERTVWEQLAKVTTAESHDRYEAALGELETAIGSDASVLELAVAQDKLCEAAEWLKPMEFDVQLPDRLDLPEEVFVPFTPILDPNLDLTVDAPETRTETGTTDPTKPIEFTEDELAVNPQDLDLSDLEERITSVTDETQLRDALAAEMAGPDRVEAREAIETQLETVTGETTPVAQPETTVAPAELQVDPRTVTVAELESKVKDITDETELKTMLNLELTDQNRTTAKSAIETQLRNVTDGT